jgi:predicted glycosyltransferase
MRKKIIFVSYGGGHVNMLLPVIKALKASSSFDVVVLGLTTAGKVLERNHIPYLGFKDLLHLADESALMYGKKIVGTKSNSSVVSIAESQAYMGINYLELVNRYGEQKASELYSREGRQSFFPIDILKEFLSEQNPDLLVATNSPRSERAAIEASTCLGIPSICLVDLFAFQESDWISKPQYATKVCVLSYYVKHYLESLGRNESDIFVTGNPSFDSLTQFKGKNDHHKKQGYSKVILWASQVESVNHPFDSNLIGDPKLPRNIETELCNIASKHPDWLFIFRHHPSENIQFETYLDNVVISEKCENLYKLISSVDIVITMTSTVAVESALIGKPIITVDLSIFTKDAPYSEMGLSIGVKNLLEIECAIYQASSSGTRKGSIEKIVGKPGQATDNVLKVIDSLLLQ